MILSTAYTLILGLNFAPHPLVDAAPPPPMTSTWASGPSEPISLAVGDELGMALFASESATTPPKLRARIAAANAGPASWTVMPDGNSVHLATTH